MSFEKVRSRETIGEVSTLWVILLVISIIIGYLDTNNTIGIIWGLTLALTWYVCFVPLAGAIIYHLIIVPWVNSFVTTITPAMSIMTIVWIVLGYIISITILILVIVYILVRSSKKRFLFVVDKKIRYRRKF